jgi:protein-disulfide isomerase
MAIAAEVLAGDVNAADHCARGLGSRAVLMEYGDFDCQRCALADSMVRGIRRYYDREVTFVFRHYPRVDLHLCALAAAQACEAAAMQGGFWKLHDAIFQSPRTLTPEDILRHAEELDLDVRRLKVDAASNEVRCRIERDFQSGRAAGVETPPAFFVNGRLYDGDLGPIGLADAVRRVIGR